MDASLALVNIGIQQGFKGYKRKSSTLDHKVDVGGLSAFMSSLKITITKKIVSYEDY